MPSPTIEWLWSRRSRIKAPTEAATVPLRRWVALPPMSIRTQKGYSSPLRRWGSRDSRVEFLQRVAAGPPEAPAGPRDSARAAQRAAALSPGEGSGIRHGRADHPGENAKLLLLVRSLGTPMVTCPPTM
jgi:hypothetical protein